MHIQSLFQNHSKPFSVHPLTISASLFTHSGHRDRAALSSLEWHTRPSLRSYGLHLLNKEYDSFWWNATPNLADLQQRCEPPHHSEIKNISLRIAAFGSLFLCMGTWYLYLLLQPRVPCRWGFFASPFCCGCLLLRASGSQLQQRHLRIWGFRWDLGLIYGFINIFWIDM
jgi:hypothetical protein